VTEEFEQLVVFWGHWRRTVESCEEEVTLSETRCVICGHVVPESSPLRSAAVEHDRKSHAAEFWSQQLCWFLQDLRMSAFRLCGHAAIDGFQWPDRFSPGNPQEENRFWDGFTDEEVERLGPKLLEVFRARELERRREALAGDGNHARN
jgi:hypothetical protein